MNLVEFFFNIMNIMYFSGCTMIRRDFSNEHEQMVMLLAFPHVDSGIPRTYDNAFCWFEIGSN